MESTDQQILSLLSRDGRMSYTDIGRETGLSTSAAQQRVRRLEQRGVISGYRATIEPRALGRELTAFIALRPINPEDDEAIPGRVEPMAEVVSCWSVAGDASYLVLVQVENPGELDRLLTRIRTTAHATTETTIVLSSFFEGRPIIDADHE